MCTLCIGAICVAAIAISLYGAHGGIFQHGNARILAQLADANGIHVTFTPRKTSKTAPSGMMIDGYLFPKTLEDGTLSFDGRISYIHIGSQYNFTLLDNRGYVTVQEVASGTLVRNTCLIRDNILPISTITDSLMDARVIDDISSFDVACDNGKLVEFVFAGEPYVFCSSTDTLIVDSIYGEDLAAAIKLLEENTEDFPSLDSLTPQGLDLDKCELLVDATSQNDSSAVSITGTVHAARRLMNKAIQRTKDTLHVLNGEPRRSLADMSDCGCSGGMKACLFVHGFGKEDGELANTYPEYFGEIEKEASCCSSVNFIHMETQYLPWYSEKLANKVCNTALQVSGGSNLMAIENVALVAHSMGNLIISNAIMTQTCALAPSSKWISLAGPIYGSATASMVMEIWDSLSPDVQTSVCTPDGNVLDDTLYSVLQDQGLCPSMESLTSLALMNSQVSTDQLNALFLQAGETFAAHVTSSLCGVSYTGLASDDSAKMALLGVMSDHASEDNDGQVDISSCRTVLPDDKYSSSWHGGNFYKAGINHLDTTFRNGDGWWGDDRKPIKWFNCQF